MQEGQQVFVPSFWLLEMTNVLFNAERRKRIDKKHRDAALESIERLFDTICAGPTLSDLKTLRGYAEKYQLTCYDAEYLRVAKEMKLPLATQDANLAAAARREKTPFSTRSLCVVMLTAFSIITWRQIGWWADSLKLFQHALDMTAPIAWLNILSPTPCLIAGSGASP